MKYTELPIDKLSEFEEDAHRLIEEYEWNAAIIARILNRRYHLKLEANDVRKMAKLWKSEIYS